MYQVKLIKRPSEAELETAINSFLSTKVSVEKHAQLEYHYNKYPTEVKIEIITNGINITALITYKL